MTHGASGIWVLVLRGGRVNSLPLAWKRSRGLLLREGFRDKVTTTRAKGRISHPKMGGTLKLLASQARECVSIVTSLDTLDGIALRGRDPRVMGHHSPSHQLGLHTRNLFLPTLPWAREGSISPKVLHKHLLFHRWPTRARTWVKVEVEDKAHRSRL